METVENIEPDDNDKRLTSNPSECITEASPEQTTLENLEGNQIQVVANESTPMEVDTSSSTEDIGDNNIQVTAIPARDGIESKSVINDAATASNKESEAIVQDETKPICEENVEINSGKQVNVKQSDEDMESKGLLTSSECITETLENSKPENVDILAHESLSEKAKLDHVEILAHESSLETAKLDHVEILAHESSLETAKSDDVEILAHESSSEKAKPENVDIIAHEYSLEKPKPDNFEILAHEISLETENLEIKAHESSSEKVKPDHIEILAHESSMEKAKCDDVEISPHESLLEKTKSENVDILAHESSLEKAKPENIDNLANESSSEKVIPENIACESTPMEVEDSTAPETITDNIQQNIDEPSHVATEKNSEHGEVKTENQVTVTQTAEEMKSTSNDALASKNKDSLPMGDDDSLAVNDETEKKGVDVSAVPSTSTMEMEDEDSTEPDQLELLAEAQSQPLDEEEEDEDDLSDEQDDDSNEAQEMQDGNVPELESETPVEEPEIPTTGFAFTIAAIAGKDPMSAQMFKATALPKKASVRDFKEEPDVSCSDVEATHADSSDVEATPADSGDETEEEEEGLHKELFLEDDQVEESRDDEEEFSLHLEDDKEEDSTVFDELAREDEEILNIERDLCAQAIASANVVMAEKLQEEIIRMEQVIKKEDPKKIKEEPSELLEEIRRMELVVKKEGEKKGKKTLEPEADKEIEKEGEKEIEKEGEIAAAVAVKMEEEGSREQEDGGITGLRLVHDVDIKPESEPEDAAAAEPTEGVAEANDADIVAKGVEKLQAEKDASVDESAVNDSVTTPLPSTPSKTAKLATTQSDNVSDIVCLEESSSDCEDVRAAKSVEPAIKTEAYAPVTKAEKDSLSEEIQIVSDSDETRTVSTEATTDVGDASASLAANKATTPLSSLKPAANDTATPKVSKQEEKKKIADAKEKSKKPKFSLEIFSLDSDEEVVGTDAPAAQTSPEKQPEDKVSPPAPSMRPRRQMTAVEMEEHRRKSKCLNYKCAGVCKEYIPATGTVLSCYGIRRSRGTPQFVCQECCDKALSRMEDLVNGIREFKPLIDLNLNRESMDIVEISDSESDSDEDAPCTYGEKLSEHNLKLLGSELEDAINGTWKKYKLEERLAECKTALFKQLSDLETRYNDIDAMFASCQTNTDAIRNSLYETFKTPTRESRVLHVVDTPWVKQTNEIELQNPVRKKKTPTITPPTPCKNTLAKEEKPIKTSPKAKDGDAPMQIDDSIALVKMTKESAPSWLPPFGELVLKPLKVNEIVYALRGSTFGAWSKARVLQIWPKGTMLSGCPSLFTICSVKFDSRIKGTVGLKQLSGRQLAYNEPSNVRYPIGTRVIALFKDALNTVRVETYYSGIVAEMPTPMNQYRYLVFFDDGYASYVEHGNVLAVCETSGNVWDDVHPDSRDFVRNYLTSYPERPMVRLQPGQFLKTEWNGKWCMSRVIQVDASLVLVKFEEDARNEWIYRGSTRLAPLFLELQAAGRKKHRTNRLQLSKPNMPYVEYTRTDEQQKPETLDESTNLADRSKQLPVVPPHQQRAVARKSTTETIQVQNEMAPPSHVRQSDSVMSRVVYYSPKSVVKPYKMVTHKCGVQCQRKDVIPLKDLKFYNPLARPLLVGWERQKARFKGRKVVIYRAPCGRRLRDMTELHHYLRTIRSDYTVDLFDYSPSLHCLAEFVLNKPFVYKKDLSQGKEYVPIPCVNYYDNSLPEYCVYNTERTPTAGVDLNLDPDFLCGCDCTDDCKDKTKCDCWKMTLEGAKTIGLEGDVGYSYRRLQEPVPTGIYECNSRCKCAKTCLNRVVQNPLQLKLQVFKTQNRGWGIRALNDVPKGGFLCIYAGNLLTDDTANRDGKREGDEYLAELDYIEAVEQMKEGYESDVPEDAKEQDRRDQQKGDDNGAGQESEEDDEDEDEEEEEEKRDKNSEKDTDFRPEQGLVNLTTLRENAANVRSRLRERKKKEKEEEKAKKVEEQKKKAAEGGSPGPQTDYFITISDDEEVREPSSFAAQANLNNDEYMPKHKSVRSFFGEDEDCFIMDAKVQGNIGRYLNHSCQPNVFVQNVFVDTHDPRFPWVSFFAMSLIKAGTELTWNYNYDIGSVPGKVMYCKCGAPNCRGRLL